jgi:hypothetical protein
MLLHAQLIVADLRASDDADAIGAYWDDAVVSDHPTLIEFVGKAAAARLLALEAEDRRQHQGQQNYVSPIATERARVTAAVAAWRTAHPGPAERVRRLTAARAVRAAELAHLRAESIRHLLSPLPGHDLPERVGDAPEKRPQAQRGGIVMGKAFAGER